MAREAPVVVLMNIIKEYLAELDRLFSNTLKMARERLKEEVSQQWELSGEEAKDAKLVSS